MPIDPATAALLERLPDLSDAPPGYRIVNEGPIPPGATQIPDAEQFAEARTRQAAYKQRLADWGFQRGATRSMGRRPIPTPGRPFMPVLLAATVMEFDSVAHARAAVEWQRASLLNDARDHPGIDEVAIEPIGNEAFAAAGTMTPRWSDAAPMQPQPITVAHIWVQDGFLVYSLVRNCPPEEGISSEELLAGLVALAKRAVEFE